MAPPPIADQRSEDRRGTVEAGPLAAPEITDPAIVIDPWLSFKNDLALGLQPEPVASLVPEPLSPMIFVGIMVLD